MLRSSLKPYLDIVEKLEIDTTLRAEQVPVETFIEIAKRLPVTQA